MNLIKQYIELLRTPQIPDDLFLKRLSTIYSEFIKFEILKELSQDSINTVKNFITFALNLLKKDVLITIKRNLLDTLELFVYILKLKEIMKDIASEDLAALYEKRLFERALFNILIKLGYFDNKLKTELLKAAQEENIDLLKYFSMVQLSLVKENKISIIKELHFISKEKDKESEQELKDAIEMVIANLEKEI